MHCQWLLCCLVLLWTVSIVHSEESCERHGRIRDCSYRSMTVFPDFREFVTKINLRGNYFRTFPYKISNYLEVLDLSYNELRQEKVKLNEKMEILDISFNYLPSLNMSSCYLRTLNASNNFIVNIDISECAFINYLQLSNNKISQIQRTLLSGMHRQYLTYLDLSGNPIINVAEDSFLDTCKLITLRLGNAHLSTLPEGLLKCHTSIKYLYLAGNNITDVPQNIFVNLKNLEILELQRNRLKLLPNHVFKNLFNLRILNLDDNELSFMQSIMFSRLHSLQHLSVRGNHLIEVPSLHGCSGPLRTAVFNDNKITDISERVVRSLLRNGFVVADLRNNLISKEVCNWFQNASDILCSLSASVDGKISLSVKDHGEIIF